MCAIMPCTPSVVTLPLIVPSSATRKLPLPFACVFTGGTSSAPVRLTFIAPLPGIQAGILSRIPAQPARATIAAIANSCFTSRLLLEDEPVRRMKQAGG